MKRVTIDIDDAFAMALSITAAGSDGVKLRMSNVLMSPKKCNCVMIDDTGNYYVEQQIEVDDAAD